ncbi:MAG: hypothetical protein HKN76_12275 [Saprospiraceae bacterium]|nr:hypothetical protein [Saprospiraceae bacterium]
MRKLNTDRIISICAIILSLGSLFIIVYQTSIIRDGQKASVMPYLEIGMGLSDLQQSYSHHQYRVGLHSSNPSKLSMGKMWFSKVLLLSLP